MYNKRERAAVWSIGGITFECPELQREVTSTDVEIDGGCSGHDEGSYCYCDSPHLIVKCECADKRGRAYFHSLFV